MTKAPPARNAWDSVGTPQGRRTASRVLVGVGGVLLLLAVGSVALFFRSRTGIAMRATAFDQEAARAQGINVGRIFSIAWAIGAVLAAGDQRIHPRDEIPGTLPAIRTRGPILQGHARRVLDHHVEFGGTAAARPQAEHRRGDRRQQQDE